MPSTRRGGGRPRHDPARRPPSAAAEFLRGPWFALTCVLGVVVLIVLLGTTATDPAAVLTALAGVLAALAVLIGAAARFRR